MIYDMITMSPVMIGNRTVILLHCDEESNLRKKLFNSKTYKPIPSHQCLVLKSIKAEQVNEHEECFLHLKHNHQHFI